MNKKIYVTLGPQIFSKIINDVQQIEKTFRGVRIVGMEKDGNVGSFLSTATVKLDISQCTEEVKKTIKEWNDLLESQLENRIHAIENSGNSLNSIALIDALNLNLIELICRDSLGINHSIAYKRFDPIEAKVTDITNKDSHELEFQKNYLLQFSYIYDIYFKGSSDQGEFFVGINPKEFTIMKAFSNKSHIIIETDKRKYYSNNQYKETKPISHLYDNFYLLLNR